MLHIAAKARTLMNEIAGAAKQAPAVMIGGAIAQSLFGVVRLVMLMAPLHIVYLKISGTHAIRVPTTSLSISVNSILLVVAAGLIVAGYTLTALDCFIDDKRRKYADSIRQNGELIKSRNIAPFYSIIKSSLSIIVIFPIILYLDPIFTIIVCGIILMTIPAFILSRRISAQEQRSEFMNAIINSRTTGAFTIGILVAAALIHIASVDHISHEAAAYFLVYFMLLRQLAAAVQRAVDGFHRIRL